MFDDKYFLQRDWIHQIMSGSKLNLFLSTFLLLWVCSSMLLLKFLMLSAILPNSSHLRECIDRCSDSEAIKLYKVVQKTARIKRYRDNASDDISTTCPPHVSLFASKDPGRAGQFQDRKLRLDSGKQVPLYKVIVDKR